MSAAVVEQQLTDAQLVNYRDQLNRIRNTYNQARKTYNTDALEFNRLSTLRVDASSSAYDKSKYAVAQQAKLDAMSADLHTGMECLSGGVNIYSEVFGEKRVHEARLFVAAYEEAASIFLVSNRRGLALEINDKPGAGPYFARAEESDARAQAQISLIHAGLNDLHKSFTGLLRTRNIPLTPPSVLEGLIR